MNTDDLIDDSFPQRIQTLIDEHGRKKLSELTGMSVSQLQKLRTGSDTTRKNLIALAEAASVNLLWLATGDGPQSWRSLSEVQEPRSSYSSSRSGFSDDYAQIPVMDVRASAGHGTVSESEDVAAVYAYRRDWLRDVLGASAEDLRIITVQGESMAPTLRSGELIFVDTRLDRFTGDGIYILRMGDDVLVKHVQRLPGQVLRVTSENTNYASFDIRLDEASNDEVAIVGRVVWAVSGRRI